jgi:hypothetical protein
MTAHPASPARTANAPRPAGHRRPTRLLAQALITAAAITAAGTAAWLTTGPASASTTPTSRNWITTGWGIHLANQADPLTVSHFFNTPGSFGTGSNAAASPVTDGFATSAVLAYSSYAQFAADVAAGAISYPYRWVMYDPENWSQTPVGEQQDPAKYLRLFGQLAHLHGYKVIETPARDLGGVTGALCPLLLTGDNLDLWYLRCGIAAAAARYSDIYVLQAQVDTTNLTAYAALFTAAKAQALAANPKIIVDTELSTNYGTPAQMAAAAQSVNAGGYYLSLTTPTLSQANQFLQIMHTAGF